MATINTKANWAKINSIKEELTTTYATPTAINQVLSHYLRAGNRSRNGFPVYYCNQHKDKHPGVTINTSGKVGCGCFPCGIFCKNPIDVCKEFGEIYSFPQNAIEAAEILGLISSTEAAELLDGNIVQMQPKPKNVVPKPVVTTYEKKEYDLDKADKIYRIFSNLNQLTGKPRLTDEDKKDLVEKRKLSAEEIDKIGFFSFPNESIKLLINEMQRIGLTPDDLKYIPGFFYNKKDNWWGYNKISGKGYCIPIRNMYGKIVAIQIRLSGENVAIRYFWFASPFAMHTMEAKDSDYTYGNSPGTPFCVTYPKELKTRTVLITEGFYKAYEYSRTFNGIAISVQGVNNIAGITDVINELNNKLKGGIANIIIAFDADMAIKETVLKPAIKLGATILNMPDDLRKKLDMILSSGQKTESNVVGSFDSEHSEIGNFFATQKTYRIFYCIWDLQYEKGMDDLIHAGHKDKLKNMSIEEFWEKAYRILKISDNYKLKEMNKNNAKFTEVTVPENVLTNLFVNLMLEA